MRFSPALPIAACCLLLAGCGAGVTPVVAVGAADLASVATFHRGAFDLAYSAITGRNCSVVRLDRGETYCKPTQPPPQRPPYCTRSLGTVDCWADPAAVTNLSAEVADGPSTLTPEQERNRAARWPDL